MEHNMQFIDTHCHMNLLVKKGFDTPLTDQQCADAAPIIQHAHAAHVTHIINVGTSVIESENCIKLSRMYKNIFSVVGIHPCDLTHTWQKDFEHIKRMVREKETHKIVGIGETGIDLYHFPSTLQRQYDGFRAHIELALEHNLALIVHTRQAPEETLAILHEYRTDITRGIIHCFPYDLDYAHAVIAMNFHLGMGGTITYPHKTHLHNVVQHVPLEHIVLETDAPFLPPQVIRGQKNSPDQIPAIAECIAQLKDTPIEVVAQKTTLQAAQIFQLEQYGGIIEL
jgi:TatD DNase family protein